MTTNTAADVAPVEQKPLTLMQRVSAPDMKQQIAAALPAHVRPERIARIALTALRKDVKLQRCTPESFLGALMTAAQLGLEVNTPAGEAYLIPYGDECTFVLGYQGIVKLFWQHPQARHIDAQAVHANDEFDYGYGTNPFLHHKPATGDRGDVTYYYAVATLHNGGASFVVLTPDECKALRGGKVGPDSRFKGGDPQRWMERKTALRQLFKTVPKTVELSTALQADEKVRTNYRDALDAADSRDPLAAVGAVTTQRVTAAEITGQAAPADCQVCGPLGEQGHDLELHEAAGVPV